MANIRPIVNKLYYMPKPNRWQKGVGALLPESYKKFWHEWKLTQPEPVHYIPVEGKYTRKEETGEVFPVQNIPLPLIFPKEYDKMLLGGEAIVQGFVKKKYNKRRVVKFWVPHLHKTVVYTEVLDKYMDMYITRRAMELIHKNHGLDFYLLNTRACDLRSLIALKLKRKILFALYDKTLYPNDSEKREEIYNKYKQYLDSYTREDLEWYGLTYNEAVLKYLHKEKEEAAAKIQPLKLLYREKLIEELKFEKEQKEAEQALESRKQSWLDKLNPFSKSTTTE